MKSTIIKFFLVALIFNVSSCKKKSSFTDYKYADITAEIYCSSENSKLLNEALYAFEDDIINNYDKQNKNTIRAYNSYIRIATTRKAPVTTFVSEHAVNVLKALKGTDIFTNGKLNYESSTIKCIAENIKEEDLKTTFNALLSTNSMRKDLFAAPLQSASTKVAKDKYLALYVALEFFYGELLNEDLSKIDFNKPESAKPQLQKPNTPTKPDNSKVDFNKRPAN